MDIAVSQGMEGFKILYLINLKTNVRVGIHGSPGSTAQIDYLIIILFHPVKFDPGHIDEITLFATFRANFRWLSSCNEKSAKMKSYSS